MEAGVTPVSVWAPGFGIDRVSLESSTADALKNPDWRWRMQALADVTAGKLKVDASAVAPLTRDPHVLVRRHAMFALGALHAMPMFRCWKPRLRMRNPACVLALP